MANVSETSSYDKWRPSEDWNSPVILYSPFPVKDIKKRVQTLSTDVGIADFVEFIQVIGDKTDLLDASLAADNSTTVAAIVINNEHNREMLARDNSVDTYSSLTKSTARFAANTEIDVVFLTFPGLIVASKVIDSVGAAGYKAFTRVQCAGTNRVDVYATAGAQLGFLLTQVVNTAALQWVAIAINRGY